MPPTVSFTHPMDMGEPPRQNHRVSTMNPMAQMPRPMPHPPPVNTNYGAPPQRQSLAQRLYASSGSNTAAPMISHEDIKTLSTAPDAGGPSPPPPNRMSMLPTPPPTNSPPGNMNGRPSSYFPNMPSPPPVNHMNSYPTGLGSNMYHSSASMHLNSHSFPHPHPHEPHRTQSLQVPPPPPPKITHHNGHARPHHAYTLGPQYSNTPTPSGPRPTPHLTTTARPPQQLQSPPSSTQSSPLPNNVLSPLSMNAPEPPSSSVLFSQPLPPPFTASPVSPPPCGDSVENSLNGGYRARNSF